MSLDAHIQQLMDRAAEQAFLKARAKYGQLEVVQAPDPYHRHDLKSASKRLGRSTDFVKKLPLKWFTDAEDHYHQKQWVLEKDLRAYLDDRVAAAVTQRDLRVEDADSEIKEMLGLSQPDTAPKGVKGSSKGLE